MGGGELAPGSVQPRPTEGQCQSVSCHPGAESWAREQPGGRGIFPSSPGYPPPPSVLGLQEGSLLATAWESVALIVVRLWAELRRSTPSDCPYRWGGGVLGKQPEP